MCSRIIWNSFAGKMRSSPETNAYPLVRVAAAVIRRSDGAVLLGLRSPGGDQGGLWEFPGGKLESRERQIDALARELEEELGIGIKQGTPLIRVLYQYPDKRVDLEILEVAEWSGEPVGREGQKIRWVKPTDLSEIHFPAANLPIIKAVSLPRTALITPSLQTDVSTFLQSLERCLDGGIELIQLRLEPGGGAEVRRLHREAVSLCNLYAAKLLINGRCSDILHAGAHGLHLNARRLLQLSERPLCGDFMVSASCHNIAELQHAERLGVDFVYVSPVHKTQSHPDRQALGWHRLRQFVRRANVPVFALGGMHADDTRLALRAGCQGVAMMSGLWDKADPRQVLDRCRESLLASAYVARSRME